MATTNTPCAMLIAEFRSAANMLDVAVKGPMQLVNAVDRMIRNAAIETLQVAQSEIDAIAEQLGLNGVEDDLAWMKTGMMIMKNCSTSIAENPLIQNALDVDLSAIDDAGSSDQLPGFSRRYAENMIKQNAFEILDQGLASIGLGSKIGLTQMRYLDILKSAGILDGLDLMKDVISCMEMVCDHYADYQTQYSGYLSSLKINADYEVSGILFPSATAEKQAAIDSTVSAATALQNQIDAWEIA